MCLDNVPAPISDEEFEEAGQPTIKCPVCRNSVRLPPGGVKELPAAFLINNLLEIQNAVNVQLPMCDKHERVLEFYKDSMIANVDSANDRMISGGDEIRKAIIDAVERLHRQIEEKGVVDDG